MRKSSREYWDAYKLRPGFIEHNRERSKRRREEHGAILARIKNVPCIDCGGRYHHSQMEFDHRPGEVKSLSIGRMKAAPIEKLLDEITKCDIVCANCHALRTWTRAQSKQHGK